MDTLLILLYWSVSSFESQPDNSQHKLIELMESVLHATIDFAQRINSLGVIKRSDSTDSGFKTVLYTKMTVQTCCHAIPPLRMDDEVREHFTRGNDTPITSVDESSENLNGIFRRDLSWTDILYKLRDKRHDLITPETKHIINNVLSIMREI